MSRIILPVALLAFTVAGCADEGPAPRVDLPPAERLDYGCEPAEPEAGDLEGRYTLFLANTDLDPVEIARFDAQVTSAAGDLSLELTPLPPALDAFEPVGASLPPVVVARGADGVFSIADVVAEIPAASLEERDEDLVVAADFEGVHCDDSPAWRGVFEGAIVEPGEEPIGGVWYLVR